MLLRIVANMRFHGKVLLANAFRPVSIVFVNWLESCLLESLKVATSISKAATEISAYFYIYKRKFKALFSLKVSFKEMLLITRETLIN